MTVFNDTEKLNILSDLIAIKSVNDNEKEVAEYLQKLFTKHDIEAKLVNVNGNRANLVAEIGSGHPVLGLTGHMDVVSPGNVDNWDSDPFKLTEKDGVLYGRGISDMKSGLAAMAITMIELHNQGLPKQGTIRLMATLGEEVGEQGSAEIAKDGYMNDVDGLVIGEPTGFNISYAQKGSMDVKITSLGKTSHSSMPELGFNAIDPLMKLLEEANQVFRDNKKSTDSMGPLVFNTTTIEGGTQINSIPDSAVANVNVRTVPEYNNEEVLNVLNQLKDKYNQQGAHINIEIVMDEGPVAGDKDNILVKLTTELLHKYAKGDVVYLKNMFGDLKETMQKYQNGDILIVVSPGITDASNMIKGKTADIPFIVAGPGNLTSHQVNEELDKQMYYDFIDMYQKLTVQFLDKITVDAAE